MTEYIRPNPVQIVACKKTIKKISTTPEDRHTSWAWEDDVARLVTTEPDVALSVLEQPLIPQKIKILYGTVVIEFDRKSITSPVSLAVQTPVRLKL